MPRTVDSQTQAQIDDLFDLYDTNRNGTIDISELGTLIRALGLSPSNAQIRDLMKKYDKDTSKTLTKEEFCTLYCDESLPDPNVEADLQRAFKAFDVDGSGKVSRKELEDALVTMGEPMSKDEVAYMFKAVDMSEKESLNFEEFQLVMVGKLLQKNAAEEEKKEGGENKSEPKSSKLPVWEELKKKLPGLEKANAEHKKERMELFREFDPNGNGYLSLAEVDANCRKILKLDEITDDLPPILMRAFTAAKDVRKAKGRNKKHGDDYVERAEFRLLFVYIYQYFELWFMFDEIDSGDDRRVNKDEFKAALPKIESWGVQVDDAEGQFKAIDTNDGGIILFKEFADWALKRKLDADGDDDDSDLDLPEEKKAEEEGEKKPEEEAPKEEEKKAEHSSKLPIWNDLKSRLPGLERDNSEHRQQRMDLFRQFDPNGNGYLSLAEVDASCRKILNLDQLTDDLPPILMRAFTAAKGIRQAKGRSKTHGDDYVERAEFRLLFVYIYQYFELWFMFDEIDSGDDRRVNKDEFKAALPKIESWGVQVDDAEGQFKAIDTNDGGIILFKEFADWALKQKLDADSGDADDSENEDEEK